MCEMYRDLVAELGDPEILAREFDEMVIRWHAARLPKPSADPTQEEIDAMQRAARAEAATYTTRMPGIGRHGSPLRP